MCYLVTQITTVLIKDIFYTTKMAAIFKNAHFFIDNHLTSE